MIHCIDVAMDGKCMGFDQPPSSGYDLRYDSIQPIEWFEIRFWLSEHGFKFKIFGGIGDGTWWPYI